MVTEKELLNQDFRNLGSNTWKVLKVTPKIILSWSLRMVIMWFLLIGILFLFGSLIVGIGVVWNWIWETTQKIAIVVGIIVLGLMFIATYHENLVRRVKKAKKSKITIRRIKQ